MRKVVAIAIGLLSTGCLFFFKSSYLFDYLPGLFAVHPWNSRPTGLHLASELFCFLGSVAVGGAVSAHLGRWAWKGCALASAVPWLALGVLETITRPGYSYPVWWQLVATVLTVPAGLAGGYLAFRLSTLWRANVPQAT